MSCSQHEATNLEHPSSNSNNDSFDMEESTTNISNSHSSQYVFVVLRANHNGHGGTFALYSLICSYAKVGLIPNHQVEDAAPVVVVSNNNELKRGSWVKSKLESSLFSKLSLLLATMLGTSMVIGDGVLTPCISVLSAVGGLKQATSAITDDRVVWISIAILVGLFMVQRFGTDKVGYTFAPIICVWFALNGGIGVFNCINYDPTVLKAINPRYIVDYFTRNKKDAWISLGGVVLTITGAEAMFADVGHFTVGSIQISMCSLTFPALILAYMGQASFLRKNTSLVSDTFYRSIPGPLYWPMFVIAVLASIIASQASISATFSIIQQSLSLGCFPHVKIVHTSPKYEGQVYIPEINFILMLASVAITAGFKTTTKIGNAYEIAVVLVMVLTSAFLVLIMMMIWNTHILLVLTYILIIASVELLYLSSVLYKFDQGGYLPLAFATILMTIMYTWNNVYQRKYRYELNHKMSLEKFKEVASNSDLCRIPGLAMFYSPDDELVQGIPPLVFEHYIANVPALHHVLVFVSIKSLPINRVAVEERFLFGRVEPKGLDVFRCVVRFGYDDAWDEVGTFEDVLVGRLKEFIGGEIVGEDIEKEIERIEKACEDGIVHLIGENEVFASEGGIWDKILVDYAYNFLKRNVRESGKVFDIPHKRMVKVGMKYEL